jgi:hypothetical protein
MSYKGYGATSADCANGVFKVGAYTGTSHASPRDYGSNHLDFDASGYSSTYQDNAPVQPNALLIQCCIKF